jgi:hypothetical protein
MDNTFLCHDLAIYCTIGCLPLAGFGNEVTVLLLPSTNWSADQVLVV